MYAIAAGECRVLQATIASACKLERMNVQSNVQRGSRVNDHVAISANATYRITLK